MTTLDTRLALLADRVSLAVQWLDRDLPDQAQAALDGVHDELIRLASEVRR